jgi:hypothetical protein
MSAYKEIRTEFRNLDSLKKALNDVGYGVMEVSAKAKENTLDLMGYNHRAYGQAVIRFDRSAYNAFEDTGFVWDQEAGVYRAVVSTHDSDYTHDGKRYQNFGEVTLKKVQQRYAYHEVKRQAAVKGYTVREVAGSDGTIRLQLTHR